MPSILIIAYYFPPEGGPAVQRISKFVKYLSKLNYKIYVITSIHFNKVIDKSLMIDIPKDVKIFRIFDPGEFLGRKLKSKFFGNDYVDQHQMWNKSVKRTASRIIKNNKIDLLFSTTPPHSTNLVASEISKLFDIPWIADFRDEWSNDPNFAKLKNSKNLISIEKEALKFCSALTTVTNKAKDNFSEILEHKIKTYCIHNGFDKEDYSDISPDQKSKNGKLTIVYSGRLTKKSSPAFLFEVLNKLEENSNAIVNDIEIIIVGKEGNKEWIKNFPNLLNIIKFLPYQPHNEVVKMLSKADALLLLATNTKNSEVFTGKLFEYFYMRKAILAVIRYEGELSEMLKDYGNTFIGIETIDNSVEHAIKKLYTEWKKNTLHKPINESFINEFDREQLTKKLSDIFQSCLREQN